jgi:uncharacterized protein YkwD
MDMLHFAENHAAKPIFIVLSLFLIIMTIVLTVAQTSQSQNIRSSAAVELKNCAVSSGNIENDQEEKKLFKLINDFRKEKNLTELKFREDLNRAAAWHSKDMAKRTKLDHKDSAGRLDSERIRDCGYNAATQLTVENVALWPDADKVFTEWKKSDGHNKNMLCKECKEVGIARDKGSDDNWYWTMDAGMQGTSGAATATPTGTGEENPTATPTATDDPDPTGNQEPTETPEEDIPPALETLPEGTTGVLFQIEIPGIGENGNNEPRHPNREISVTVADSTAKKIEEVDATVSYNPETKLFTGAVALPKIESSGGYLVNVRTPFSLIQTITSGFVALEKGALVTLPEIFLPVINFTGNNTIGVTDYIAFRNCLSTNECGKREMDVNDDGEVDVLDHNIIVEVFSKVEGE